MPVYLTGRTRTLTLTGTLNGIAGMTSVEDMPGYTGPHPNYEVSTATSGSIVIQVFEDDAASPAIITITGTNSFANRNVGPPSVLFPQSSDLTVETETGLGDNDSGTQTDSRTSLGSTTVGGAGTFTISVGTEEYFEENYSLSATSSGFASYGGTGQTEGTKARGIRFRERMKVGQTLTVSATLGTASATSSDSIAVATAITDYRVRITVNAYCEGTGNDSIWGASSTYFGVGDLGIPSYLYSGSEGYVDCTSGAKVKASASGSDSIRSSSATAQLYPAVHYNLVGTVKAMELDYGSSLTITWLQKNTGVSDSQANYTASPTIDQTVAQRRYSASGTYGATPSPPVTLNEQGPVACWFKSTSLSGNGEDTRDWRILAHGKLYSSFTITHADYTVDDGSSAAEWTTTATSVTSSAGAIRIVCGKSGPYTATKTPGSPYSWEYHRYLKIRIKSEVTANQAYTVTIGSKSWNKDRAGATLQTTTAGTYVEQYIDLCCPTSTSATSDGQYTRWAETAAGSGHSATEGELWGINWPTTIVFGALASSENYDIDSLTLSRNTFARYSALPGFQNWHQAYPDSGGTHTEFIPNFILDVDGRLSDRGYYLTNVDAGTPTYSEVSLTDLISVLNSCTGMTAVTVGSFPADGYHDNSRPAGWIGGGGYLYDISSDPPETTQIDISMVSATVKAQALWDQIEGYPGIGDAWTGSSYPSSGDSNASKALPQRIVPVKRGQAVGICHKTTTAPLVGAQVKAYEATSLTVAGIGTSDAQGYYQTANPYGRGNVSHKTELQQPPVTYLSETHTWLDRLRVRASFRRDSASLSNVARDTREDFQHFRVFSR